MCTSLVLHAQQCAHPSAWPTGSTVAALVQARLRPWRNSYSLPRRIPAYYGGIMLSYRQPGIILNDLTFTVPLDHAEPGGEKIELFAREVVAADQRAADLPWLLYL